MDDDNSYGPEDSTPDPTGNDAPTGEWDSDDALSFLKMEKSVQGDESNEALTKRLLEEAAPVAAMSIINLARSSGNDNTRLNASKYIIDTLLTDQNVGGKQPWEDMMADMVDQAELLANNQKG